MYEAHAVEQLLRYVIAHEWFEVRDRSRRNSDTDMPPPTFETTTATTTSVLPPYRLRADPDRDRAWTSLLKHADWVGRQVQRLCAGDDDRYWTAVAVCGSQVPRAIGVVPPDRRLFVHDHKCTADCWTTDSWPAPSDEPVRIVIASNAPSLAELQSASGSEDGISAKMENLLNTVRATERALRLSAVHEFLSVDNLEDWRHRVHKLGVSYAYKLHYPNGTSWHKWRLHVLMESCGVLASWMCKIKRARTATKWEVLEFGTTPDRTAVLHDPPPAATVALRKHFYGLEQRDALNRSMTDYSWMNALRYEAYRHTVCSTTWHPMFYQPEVLLLLRHPDRPKCAVTLQIKLRLDWLNFGWAMRTSRDALLLAWRVELTRYVMGDTGPASYVDRLLTLENLRQEDCNEEQHKQQTPHRDGGVSNGGVVLKLSGRRAADRSNSAVSVRLPRDVTTTVLLPLFGVEDEALFDEVMTVLSYRRSCRGALDGLLTAYLSFVRLNQKLAKPFAQESVDFELCALDAACVRRLLRRGYRVQGGELVADTDPRRPRTGVDVLRRWAV